MIAVKDYKQLSADVSTKVQVSDTTMMSNELMPGQKY